VITVSKSCSIIK